MRPVCPGDLARFDRLWERLSGDTVYRRFHTPLLRLPNELRQRFVRVDHDRREALLALVGDEVIGVARYDRCAEDPAAAEIAVLIEDAWQNRGIGQQLVRELAKLATRRGIGAFTGEVQADNQRMLHIIRALAGESALRKAGPFYQVHLPSHAFTSVATIAS